MPFTVFSTPAEVGVSKEITRAITQASWVDADVAERIREGDKKIESCLASMGYDIEVLKALSTVPALVNEFSKLYARAAILRDLYTRGPVGTSEDRHEEMFKRFDADIEKLKERKLSIIKDDDTILLFTDIDEEPLVNTDRVPRALGMEEPEFQEIDSEAYSDPTMRGDPDC